MVTLCKDGVPKKFLLHRLVAEAYIPNPDNLPEVNHKDEDKSNNSVNNLEWMTKAENNNYGTRNKRLGKPIYCIELNKVFDGARAAGRELGIDYSSISKCCKGIYKSAGGYHFSYSEES